MALFTNLFIIRFDSY